MADFVRISESEWQWQQGTHHHSVRYFASTGKLIWAGWAQTSNGPVFDEGFAQPVENFLQAGAPDRNPPPELVQELKEALAPQKKSSGLFSWLNRGK